MTLKDIKHWVFDMDGTLTVAVHDFDFIREYLEIPAQADILTHLASVPADVSAAKHAWLLEHERELVGLGLLDRGEEGIHVKMSNSSITVHLYSIIESHENLSRRSRCLSS